MRNHQKTWLGPSVIGGLRVAARIRMLLVARAGRRRWCRSGGCRRGIRGQTDLPSITVADFYRCPVALELYRTALARNHKCRTPFSVFPDGIAIRANRVRGIGVRCDSAKEAHFLE